MLAVNTSLTLTMAIHELATNAVKYGALRKGEVRIAWGLVDDTAQPRLELRWQESGGPPVAPPQRKGFGSLLLARTLDGARVHAERRFLHPRNRTLAARLNSLTAQASPSASKAHLLRFQDLSLP